MHTAAQRLALCPCGALVGFDRLNHQVGQDNAILTEPVSSHADCLTARRDGVRTPSLRAAATTMAPASFAGVRVHIVDPAQRGCVSPLQGTIPP
ncbi:MAG TPA: hypothetical protein VFR47_16975 [Anaerolineales bacterium]|nr:hypothetical protein [Anaerolineales bacterium]